MTVPWLSILLLGWLGLARLTLAPALRVALDVRLAGAGDAERAGRNILADD
jgi:hypothetical protein